MYGDIGKIFNIELTFDFYNKYMSAVDEFDAWSKLKRRLDKRSTFIGFKEREVWWAYVGRNIGYEENGKGIEFIRPVLVVRVFNRRLCWVIPLTSVMRKGAYYFSVSHTNRTSVALLAQLRALDSRRFIRRTGKISISDYQKLRELLLHLLH